MRNEVIIINENEEGKFISNFNNPVFCTFQGEGVTIEESCEDLFFKINLHNIEDEKERLNLYLKETRPQALQLAKQVFDLMGVESFELHDFQKRSGLDKEEAKLKLNFLLNFGYTQPDRKKGAGKKWKVVLETSDMIKFYDSEADKYEATMKYYKALKQQLLDFEKAENTDSISESKQELIQLVDDSLIGEDPTK